MLINIYLFKRTCKLRVCYHTRKIRVITLVTSILKMISKILGTVDIAYHAVHYSRS